jgi:hypothetical protein
LSALNSDTPNFKGWISSNLPPGGSREAHTSHQLIDTFYHRILSVIANVHGGLWKGYISVPGCFPPYLSVDGQWHEVGSTMSLRIRHLVLKLFGQMIAGHNVFGKQTAWTPSRSRVSVAYLGVLRSLLRLGFGFGSEVRRGAGHLWSSAPTVIGSYSPL